jgi:aspartyl-tRNA(Asn)/glutamyl-tRNA(Gln) amidotransferase subunit A
MNFEDLGLNQAASAIRNGEISPVEYVQALLRRIEKLEPKLRCWVTIDGERALREAQICEAEVRAGKLRGPLHGVPVGLKDIFRTQGLKTTAGSRFLQDYVPGYDAECVTRLRRAGAIILGKNVTTEFATYDPGPSRNPWNPEHTPGGSSSGSAVAVGARMCPAATGTQTVGSIGRPAAYCGVVGFVPTQSRVSRAGVFPVSWSLDHIGGFTNSADDARVFLEALSGVTIPVVQTNKPIRVGVLREFFAVKADPVVQTNKPIRVGVLREFFAVKADPAVLKLHDTLLNRLDPRLFALEEAKLPEIFAIQSAIGTMIMRCELASAHKEFHHNNSSLYGRKLRALVETGMLVRAEDYLRALRLRKVYQREMARLFDKFDVLVTPGAMDSAPKGLDYTGDPSFTGPWALADFPTITLPVEVASNGLPVGIQISAPPMQEEVLFSVAELLEGTIGFNSRPKLPSF